ncbi:MAG: hypothetical protein QHC67_14865 [Sphingobium sp.]|nr:hypothetical protein [Sphingobium sp.]
MRTPLLLLAGLATSAAIAWQTSKRREPALRDSTRQRLAPVPNAADIKVPSA